MLRGAPVPRCMVGTYHGAWWERTTRLGGYVPLARVAIPLEEKKYEKNRIIHFEQ